MFFSFSSGATIAASAGRRDDDANAGAIGERDRVADLLLVSRLASEAADAGRRSGTSDSSDEVAPAVRSRGLGVRARLVEQPGDAIQLRVTLFLQVVVGAIRGRCAPSAAAARRRRRDAGTGRSRRPTAPPCSLPTCSRRDSSPRPGRRAGRRPASATTVVTPLARATGIASLSLWNATWARSCGLKSSISLASPKFAGAGILEADRRSARR